MHSEGVCEIVPLQECMDAVKKPLDFNLGGVDPCPEENSFQVVITRVQHQETLESEAIIVRDTVVSAIPPLEAVKVLVSIMVSVVWSAKGNRLQLRHYDISRAHIQGTAQRLISFRLPAEDREKFGHDKVGRLVKNVCGAQDDAPHIWQLDHELGVRRLWRLSARRTQRRHFSHGCEDVAVRGDDFESLADEDSLQDIDDQLNSKNHWKEHGDVWGRHR